MLTELAIWALRRWRQGKLCRLPRAQALGPLAEDLAAQYLLRSGLRIHERNWRPRTGRGEIDIIASEGLTLVFVEVKARTTDEFGAPDRAIGEEKRRHIASRPRRFFLAQGDGPRLYPFDTVSIVWPGPLNSPECASVEHVRDAFFLRGVGPTPFAAHIAGARQARIDDEWRD